MCERKIAHVPVFIEAGMKQEAAMAQYARERRGTGKAVTSDEDSDDLGDHFFDLLLDGEIDLTALAAHAQSHKAKARAKQRQVNRRNKKKTTCSLPTQPSSTPDTSLSSTEPAESTPWADLADSDVPMLWQDELDDCEFDGSEFDGC